MKSHYHNRKITEIIRHWKDTFQALSGQDLDQSLSLYADLLQEETSETLHAIQEKDRSEILDGAGDTIWIAGMIIIMLGEEVEDIIERIYDSNMSKLSEYPIDNEEIYSIEVPVSEAETKYVLRRRSDNKIMKSSDYRPPTL